jgi:hypothetical protein
VTRLVRVIRAPYDLRSGRLAPLGTARALRVVREWYCDEFRTLYSVQRGRCDVRRTRRWVLRTSASAGLRHRRRNCSPPYLDRDPKK